MIDFRLGRWEDVLADVGEVDAVITDPPYGARTHDDESLAKQVVSATGQATRTRLGYSEWTKEDVIIFCDHWMRRCRGWFVAFTSHDLISYWEGMAKACGRYSFAPVPWIDRRPRLIGDGPASWTCYLMVSRPKTTEFSRWGCLPGAYLPGKKDRFHIGGKPTWLMRAIVRDYTRPGDLVCDPCAGGATTLIAAAMEGRRAIGCEMDPETYAKAKARIAKGFTADLFTAPSRVSGEQKPKTPDLFS